MLGCMLGRLLLPALVLLVGGLAHAGVIVVAPTGQTYSQVQDAIDNASEGDTILVKTGNYLSFVISARSLSIVGDEGANVQIAGAVRVRNLAAGQRVLLANLTATGVYSATGFGQYGLYATNNIGALRLQNCALVGAAGLAAHPDGYAGAWLENCLDAALQVCTCVGGTGKDGWAGTDTGVGGAGVRASGTNAALLSCAVRGGDGRDGTDCNQSPDGGNGGDGLRALGGVLWFHAGTTRGGNGGDGKMPTSGCSCVTGAYGGYAGYAQNALNSTVIHVQGVLETVAYHGDSWGGFCGFYIGGAAPLRSGTTFLNTATTPHRLLTAPVRRELQESLLEVRGAPGDLVRLVISSRPTPAQYLNAFEGFELVPRGQPMRLMLLGTLPSSGIATFGLSGADLGAGVDAQVRYLQLLVDSAGGARRLGESACVLRLDSAF